MIFTSLTYSLVRLRSAGSVGVGQKCDDAGQNGAGGARTADGRPRKRVTSAPTPGRARDGNGDGNPVRRARSRLNGYVQLTGTKVVPTQAPLRLESKSALAGQADLRDGRARHPADLPEGLPHAVPGAELHESDRR